MIGLLRAIFWHRMRSSRTGLQKQKYKHGCNTSCRIQALHEVFKDWLTKTKNKKQKKGKKKMKKATKNTNTDAIHHGVFKHYMKSSRPSLQNKTKQPRIQTRIILHAVFRHRMRSSRPSLQTNKQKKQPRIQTRMQYFMLYSGTA